MLTHFQPRREAILRQVRTQNDWMDRVVHVGLDRDGWLAPAQAAVRLGKLQQVAA